MPAGGAATWFLAPLLLVAPNSPPLDPSRPLQELIGVPYREDGVEVGPGRWATFSAPGTTRTEPGLNCSGFAMAAARRLLGWRGTPAEAARDRAGNSGPCAPLGEDWDFGLDLILNLSEGCRRVVLLPARDMPPEGGGEALRGFRIHDDAAWAAVLPRLQPGATAWASFSRRTAGRLAHHHVAVIVADAAGTVWLYQTLPAGRVHRLPVSRPEGLERLRDMFGPGEYLLILRVEPRR